MILRKRWRCSRGMMGKMPNDWIAVFPSPWLRAACLRVACVGLACVALASCASRAFSPGEGRGLTTASAEAPAGVVAHPKPKWSLGDRFTYRRGGKLRLLQSVVRADDEGYALEEAITKLRTDLGMDFQQTRESVEGDPWAEARLVPGDWRLSWPLWVGKRWVCEYMFKKPGEDGLPVVAEYRCDAGETITTPAGRFECLRIWRIARPAIEGRQFLDQASLAWYSPEVGAVVRQLKGGVVTELESYQRQ